MLSILKLIPNDNYSRGEVDFNQPTLPSAFFYVAAESLCEATAKVVLDNSSELYPIENFDVSLGNLVSKLMSIPESDSRYNAIHTELQNQYQNLINNNVTPRAALKLIFTIACLSPDVMGLGL